MTIYSLDISFSYLEPICCSMSSSTCCFPTCIQISQEAGQVVWYSHLFQNFHSLLWSIVKGFGIVSKAQIDVSLELSCVFDDPEDVDNLISVWKFTVHVLPKPGLENFEHYFASMWDECSYAVFEHSLAFPFFGIGKKWNENWPFPVLWPLLSFPNLLAYWVQHFHSIIISGFEIAQLEFHHLH